MMEETIFNVLSTNTLYTYALEFNIAGFDVFTHFDRIDCYSSADTTRLINCEQRKDIEKVKEKMSVSGLSWRRLF